MTLQQFLDKLAETPRDWQLRGGNGIRDSELSCPLQVVFGKQTGYAREARDAGLSDDEVANIISASDNVGDLHYRPRLLKACGL